MSFAVAPSASTYPVNPVRTPAVTAAPLAIAPSAPGDRLRSPSLVVESCTWANDKCTLGFAARGNAGAFVASPRAKASDAPDPFAEISAFAHAAEVLRWFEDRGRAWPTKALGPLRIVTNVPMADAMYLARGTKGLPAGVPDDGVPTVWLGRSGAIDLAYDATVIAHEVTHAVLEQMAPRRPSLVDGQGTDVAPGAIAEALGDHIAAAITGDPLMGEYAAKAASKAQVRSLDVALTCPASLVGRAHEDGLLVSSILWNVRKNKAADDAALFDRAVITAWDSLELASLTYRAFEDAIAAALARAGDTATAATLRTAFAAAGLDPECRRIRDLDPTQTTSGASGAFAAPHGAPAVMQFRLPKQPDATAIRFRFQALPRSSAPTPFRPSLILRWGSPTAAPVTLPTTGDFVREARLDEVEDADLYLQIANDGAVDGTYDVIGVVVETRKASSADAGANVAANAANDAPSEHLSKWAFAAPGLVIAAVLGWVLVSLRKRST